MWNLQHIIFIWRKRYWQYFTSAKWRLIIVNFEDVIVFWLSVCVCVCMYVCVCACVYLFPFTVKLLLTEQNNKCNARIQVSEVRSGQSSGTFVATSYITIARTVKLATVKRVSIKPGKAARSKRQLFKTFSKPTVKARSIATFLLTNLGSRSASAQGQILANCTTPRGVL